jgi:Domain of unknown function (DUF1905)
MRSERFTGVLLVDHNGGAVEVPFDPTHRWTIPAIRLGAGRYGHPVRGRLNGLDFDSVIVSRAGASFLMVSDQLRNDAGLAIGDSAQITLHPEHPPGGHGPSAATPSHRRRTRRPPATP